MEGCTYICEQQIPIDVLSCIDVVSGAVQGERNGRNHARPLDPELVDQRSPEKRTEEAHKVIQAVGQIG